MAVVKLGLKKNTEALTYAKKAAAAAPNNASYAYTLGQASEAVSDTSAAVNAYRKAASLDAKYLRPRINLGSIYLELGLVGEARECLLEGYRIDPRSFEVNNNLGAAYAREENWSASVEHYEKALAVDSRNATVRLNFARALAGAGSLPQARDAYREVIKVDPANWDAVFELGKTYVSLGDPASAKSTLQDLVTRNPAYPARGEAEKILAGL
jgi:tetratricopeptide (TPR) repeat protein